MSTAAGNIRLIVRGKAACRRHLCLNGTLIGATLRAESSVTRWGARRQFR